MSDHDDRLERALQGLAPPADPEGAFDEVVRRKRRHRFTRRLQAGGLALGVLAGSVAGALALMRAFEGEPREPAGSAKANGLIAFVRASRGTDLFVVRPDGSGLRRLFRGPGDERDPAWSPDGRLLAFVIERDGPADPFADDPADLYVMDVRTGEVRRLTDDRAIEYSPTWSPDGTRIAFSKGHEEQGGLYVMEADGTGLRRLTDERRFEGQPAWSPDGERIAFASAASDELPQLHLLELADGSTRPLTDAGPMGLRFAVSPSWSPDGTRIAFFGAHVGSAGDIYVIGADGTGLRKLTHDLRSVGDPAWSPDGRLIAFSANTGIHVMSADGSHLRRLTRGAVDYEPAWQPAPS